MVPSPSCPLLALSVTQQRESPVLGGGGVKWGEGCGSAWLAGGGGGGGKLVLFPFLAYVHICFSSHRMQSGQNPSVGSRVMRLG